MRFPFFLLSLLWIISSVACGEVEAEKLYLAKDGIALVEIVVSDDAIPAEKTAAKELQKYLNQITGGEFSITNKASKGKSAIYVGRGGHVDEVCKDTDFDFLGTDGVVIRTINGNLILTGGRPRGTIYAVYTFLQDYLGCRWYAPDEEKIPTETNLSIKPIDLKYVPKLFFREYYSVGAIDTTFQTRLRMNGREYMNDIPEEFGGSIRMGVGHTLGYIFIKPADHFKEHPEWFAWRAKEKKRVEAQLCLTNPELQKQVLKEVLQYLDKEHSKMPEHHRLVSVSCGDNNLFCQCENCMKVLERENTPAGPLVELLNFVAKGVKEKYPDVYVNTLAYWHTDMPPRTLKCEDNIIVQIGTLDRNHKLAIGDTRFHKIIQGWKKAAKHIYIWDYDANFRNFIQPHPNHLIVDKSLQYYEKNGVEGVFLQGPWGAGAELYPLRTWVHSQIMWDARKNPEKLIEEFCNEYYGPAGKYILQYINLINRAVNRNKAFFLGAYNKSTDKWLTLEDLNEATRLFNSALKAVDGDDKLTRRIRLAKMSIDIVWLQRYRELQQEAQKSGKPFLGPQDPYAEMDRLEKNEFGIDCYGEGNPYFEYLQKLRKKFPKRSSALPQGFEKIKTGQWEEIQENFFICKKMKGDVEADSNASNKKALVVRGDPLNGKIIYTIPEELAGKWRILLTLKAEPADGYKIVDIPVCIYYRRYPEQGIKEIARTYVSFNEQNCNNYQTADFGELEFGVGTEIQIQPSGVGHYGKAKAIMIDRIVLIQDTDSIK